MDQAKSLRAIMEASSNSGPRGQSATIPVFGTEKAVGASSVSQVLQSFYSNSKIGFYCKESRVTIIDFGETRSLDQVKPSHCPVIVMTPGQTSMRKAFGLVARLKKECWTRKIFLFVNKVTNKSEATEAFKRLSEICQHYLEVNIELLGSSLTIKENNLIKSMLRTSWPQMEISKNSILTIKVPGANDEGLLKQPSSELRGRLGRFYCEVISHEFQ